MMRTSRKALLGSLLLAALGLASCSIVNGWGVSGDDAANPCKEAYQHAADRFGAQRIMPRREWEVQCKSKLLDAISPCHEYRYGTDSALECLARRREPALDFLVENLLLGNLLTAKQEIRSIQLAAVNFETENRRPPTSVYELYGHRFLAAKPTDPWGEDYVLEWDRGGLRAKSKGPDRKLGTADDIDGM